MTNHFTLDYVNHSPNYDYQVHEVVWRSINREASTLELLQQLAAEAPNRLHQNELHYMQEEKKALLKHLNNFYHYLSGARATNNYNRVEYLNYWDGLQKAFQLEIMGIEDLQRLNLSSHHPQLQQVGIWAYGRKHECAKRLQHLYEHNFPQQKDEYLIRRTDYGSQPFVVDIEKATIENNTFRTAIWTGQHLQVTVMSIEVGEDIGLEVHPHLDQFLRIEEGEGLVQMGDSRDRLDFEAKVSDDFAIMVPAGKWHNLTNTGRKPIKLYSIYAPPQHPYGTVHETKAIAMAAEEGHQQ